MSVTLPFKWRKEAAPQDHRKWKSTFMPHLRGVIISGKESLENKLTRHKTLLQTAKQMYISENKVPKQIYKYQPSTGKGMYLW